MLKENMATELQIMDHKTQIVMFKKLRLRSYIYVTRQQNAGRDRR